MPMRPLPMNTCHSKCVLQVAGVTQEYNHKNIIEDIHIHLNQGEFVSILGPSGCGKSTLSMSLPDC